MEDLKFSIITPVLNHGRYIHQAIESVMAQDYKNFEHIVVDGGSTDETIEILKKYHHLRWISERDEGLSDAFNKGIRMATGNIIGWCSADDYYLPGAFKVVSKELQEKPDIMVVYGDHRNIDEHGVPFEIKREIDFNLFILKYLHMNYIRTSSSFWRKKLHDLGYWFDKNFHFSMDYDFMCRVARDGYKFRHLRTLLIDFRIHSQAKSADSSQIEEHERIVRAHMPVSPNAHPYVGSILRKILLGCARTKRTVFRSVHGHYFEQWWRT